MRLFRRSKENDEKLSTGQGSNAFDAPPETNNWRLYLMALSASWASAMFGYDSAFLGSTITLPSFKRAFGLTDSTTTALSSHIVATFQAGCFFGALFIQPFNSRFGRRWSLMLAGLVFSIGAIIQVVSDGRLGMMYAGRALTGLGVGSSSLLVPSYIAECSTPATRGRLTGGFEIYLQTGLVIGFWITYGVKLHIPDDGTNKQWVIPFAVQLIPSGMLLLFMFFQKESPRWLMEKGRVEQATRNLCYLRNLPADHAYIQYELDSIREAIDRVQRNHDGQKLSVVGQVKEAVGPRNRYRLFLAVSLMWLQNLSGINALNYFSNPLVKGLGFTGSTVSLLATGIFGLTKMISTIIFMVFIIDRYGRRMPLLIGIVGGAASLYYLGIYSVVAKTFDGQSTQDGAAYFGLVCIYLFSIFYAFSLNAIPWIFQAEVFPLCVRSVSMTCSVMNQWLAQFVIVYAAPYMIQSLKGYTFIFFAIWTTLTFAFCYFLYPETKGISLENMDILFAGSKFAPSMRKRYDGIIVTARGYEADGHQQGSSRDEENPSSTDEFDDATKKQDGTQVKTHSPCPSDIARLERA